jgi:hypothetical protein
VLPRTRRGAEDRPANGGIEHGGGDEGISRRVPAQHPLGPTPAAQTRMGSSVRGRSGAVRPLIATAGSAARATSSRRVSRRAAPYGANTYIRKRSAGMA